MKRHGGLPTFAPEVTPGFDLESPTKQVYGGGQAINLAGAPPGIQPYLPGGGSMGGYDGGKSRRSDSKEDMKKAAAIAGVVWLGGWFLGYGMWWPLYLVLDILYSVLSIPPFSWVFGWIWTPLSWIFSWFYQGAPIVEQGQLHQEMRLPQDQVATYLDSYAQQYSDAALIFAAHDGYPQIVQGLLYDRDLGYRDLIDATDENGNTALIYACSKGFGHTTAALLRNGADPDIANQGNGGRTPLMEAAGAGHKDIVAGLRLANASMDLIDDFGNTALHYAAYHGHLTVVHELLKGSPRRDVKNSYGHTAASYAATNKHKAIADVINRGGSKRTSRQEQAEAKLPSLAADEDDAESGGLSKAQSDLLESLGLSNPLKKKEEPKHVKGAAEKLHEEGKGSKGWKDFAPKLESFLGGVKDDERKSLEDQLAKLKRQHEEAELKAQKRIVELLEKSSDHQKTADDARRTAQEYLLNNTEMQLRIQELEMKFSSSELRASDEKSRGERLQDELRRLEFDAERHKTRAEGAEKERDMHVEAAKRHEEHLKRKQDEVNEHLSRLERQNKDTQALREDLRRHEDEKRRHMDRVEQLQRELQALRGGSATPLPPASTPSPPSPPPPPPPPPPVNEGAPPVTTEGTSGTGTTETSAGSAEPVKEAAEPAESTGADAEVAAAAVEPATPEAESSATAAPTTEAKAEAETEVADVVAEEPERAEV